MSSALKAAKSLWWLIVTVFLLGASTMKVVSRQLGTPDDVDSLKADLNDVSVLADSAVGLGNHNLASIRSLADKQGDLESAQTEQLELLRSFNRQVCQILAGNNADRLSECAKR